MFSDIVWVKQDMLLNIGVKFYPIRTFHYVVDIFIEICVHLTFYCIIISSVILLFYIYKCKTNVYYKNIIFNYVYQAK
jgi:hypothetical protein